MNMVASTNTTPSANDARFGVSDLTLIDQEPRVRDADLARALGFERERKIRDLIDRNILELESYGRVPRRGAHVETVMPTGGIRKTEVQAYHLNEPQVLLICMFSRTPTAAAVRKQMIEVFTEWRRTRHGTPKPTIPVRGHKRRTSTPIDKAISLSRSADRLESVARRIQPAQASLAWINNLPVPYDADDYRLPAGTPAVVMYQDGRISVEPAEWTGQGRSGLGVMQSMYGARCRAGFTIMGRVLGPQTGPLPPSVNGPRPVYRDAILAGLSQGLTARQVAEQTGASIHTARYWQQRRRLLSLAA